MKVLFIADIHIKLGQKNVPKDWQKNRYRMLFDKIYDASIEIPLTVLGGDIFDRMPNLEELELYFEMLPCLASNHTIIFDGNHEATKRGQTFMHKLKRVSEKMNPNIEILTESCERNGIDFIPYTELRNFDPSNFNNETLCTHVRGEIPPHVKPEISLEKFDRWRTVLAGDLHSYSNCQRNILYPGSPLSTSFHRNKSEFGAIVFDTDTHDHSWFSFDLPQLIRKTVQSEEDMVKTDFDHTIYEIEGNISDLSKVKDNELLDKKVSNKIVDAKLNLSETKTIDEELRLFLEEVVNLPKDEIDGIIGTYHDYVT